MSKKAFLLIFVAVSLSARAQVCFSLWSGVATYGMDDMKRFQLEFNQALPIPGVIISSFPAYWYYEGQLQYQFQNNRLGSSVSYGSSGGRVSYSDYSGKVLNDLRVEGTSTSVCYERLQPLSKNGTWSIGFGINVGWLFGKMKFDNLQQIGNNKATVVEYFTTGNMTLEPRVTLRKAIKAFEFLAVCGYNINAIKGNVIPKSYPDAILTNSSGDPAHLDFSGLRGGVGVTVRIGTE